MIYPIVIYGSPVLRNVSVDITPDYPNLKQLVEDMFLTLTEAEGVGLAAPQIGKNIRLFIVDCTPWGDDDPALKDYKRVFINAQIYEHSEQTDLFNEGCLSLPGLHEDVRRPVSIRMRYVDENFVEHDEEFTGFWPVSYNTNTTISRDTYSRTTSRHCAATCSKASCRSWPEANTGASTRPSNRAVGQLPMRHAACRKTINT